MNALDHRIDGDGHFLIALPFEESAIVADAEDGGAMSNGLLGEIVADKFEFSHADYGSMIKVFMVFFLYFALVLSLPLLGAYWAGFPVEAYLDFPPSPKPPLQPEPFSWPLFIGTAMLIVFCIAPFVIHLVKAPDPFPPSLQKKPFPPFGWIGLGIMVMAWILAWNRFEWFQSLQRLTFTPLWIGYILVLNGLCDRCSGESPLTKHPRQFLMLFPLSALFWWLFEYINRFVENWVYFHTKLDAFDYFIEATLPFATVLPAIVSTAAWLSSFPKLYQSLEHFWRPALPSEKTFGSISLLIGMLGLTGIAWFPKQLFPLVWVAPLFIMSGLQIMMGRENAIWQALVSGDWRRLWVYSLAGLVCGFFWELWNDDSLAHWEYQISYVGCCKIFEMPILGYAGYFPFGILCGLFADGVCSGWLTSLAHKSCSSASSNSISAHSPMVR
jgi:hypothetical protein